LALWVRLVCDKFDWKFYLKGRLLLPVIGGGALEERSCASVTASDMMRNLSTISASEFHLLSTHWINRRLGSKLQPGRMDTRSSSARLLCLKGEQICSPTVLADLLWHCIVVTYLKKVTMSFNFDRTAEMDAIFFHASFTRRFTVCATQGMWGYRRICIAASILAPLSVTKHTTFSSHLHSCSISAMAAAMCCPVCDPGRCFDPRTAVLSCEPSRKWAVTVIYGSWVLEVQMSAVQAMAAALSIRPWSFPLTSSYMLGTNVWNQNAVQY